MWCRAAAPGAAPPYLSFLKKNGGDEGFCDSDTTPTHPSSSSSHVLHDENDLLSGRRGFTEQHTRSSDGSCFAHQHLHYSSGEGSLATDDQAERTQSLNTNKVEPAMAKRKSAGATTCATHLEQHDSIRSYAVSRTTVKRHDYVGDCSSLLCHRRALADPRIT